MSEPIPCPFRVGQRVHERMWGCVVSTTLDENGEVVSSTVSPRLDESRPDATVTAITDKGFTYTYDHPIPFGRAAWGQMMTGGECHPEGYRFWVSVD